MYSFIDLLIYCSGNVPKLGGSFQDVRGKCLTTYIQIRYKEPLSAQMSQGVKKLRGARKVASWREASLNSRDTSLNSLQNLKKSETLCP